MRTIRNAITRWFLLIAEPRVQRILHFIVYISLLTGGISILFVPPAKFEGVLGTPLVFVFALFITVGSVLASLAVLPGIWWLERAGILALCTGLAMYLVITTTLGVSLAGFVFFLAFLLLFAIRWMDIRAYQLAPKRG